jgi:S-adenosylmethionine hydrolase
MRRPIITLTTDFGSRDPYAAEMKAVVVGISPNATIVDITHQIDKFNISMGAYILASAYPYFPEGTVHVAVVDPGVGTKRRPIIVQTERGCFVGPDNGLLALAARSIGGEMHIYSITNREFMLPSVSNTFHGRDIFAPAAAHLANGRRPADFGKEIYKMISPGFMRTIRRKDAFEGQVIHIDDFGNIITSFTAKQLQTMKIKDEARLKIGEVKRTLKLCKAYGDVKKRQPLAIIGSSNLLEISVNQDSAASKFNVQVGNKISIFCQ